ncbi:mitochondrial import receptor subunit TOM20-like [Solanum tuberosum]|uniref:Mitochondrial import receptor subunit TOM20 n=1 Tax=Solanum tuberosum TaxID=4113 RepID=M1C038_SOLTU|nr:PREDICTED: mitochondrial import receptor subunit TOM20-like [Solanum tuberosum]
MEMLLSLERARKSAETSYPQNPRDGDNLARWGRALLNLARFEHGVESKQMISDAISRLEKALTLKPKKKHDVLWCLGNAYTSYGLLTTDMDAAALYFEKATMFFKQASDADPSNDLYRKSLDAAAKISKKESININYDIFYWVILAAGIVAWVGFAKSDMSPPPPPPPQ